MSHDIKRLSEEVAQLSAVLNELREQGHAHLAVMRTASTETQLAADRAQRQAKVIEDNLLMLGKRVTDTSVQLQKSFTGTAVVAGQTLAGEMGASFGKQANRELEGVVRRLEQAIAQTQAMAEQQRAGWRWMAWGGYGFAVLLALLLATAGWWIAELHLDKAALIEQRNEARQAAAAVVAKPKSGTTSSPPTKPSNGAR